MQAAHVDAFLTSVFEVLGQQAAARPERGSPVLRTGETLSTHEVTVLVALQGDLTGMMFYGMSLATAGKLTAVISGRPAGDLRQLDLEATLQLARQSVAASVTRLAEQGCQCVPDDPVIVQGYGERLTAVSPVLLVPMFTEYGDIDIGLTLHTPGSIPSGVPLILARPVGAIETMAATDDDSADASARREGNAA